MLQTYMCITLYIYILWIAKVGGGQSEGILSQLQGPVVRASMRLSRKLARGLRTFPSLAGRALSRFLGQGSPDITPMCVGQAVLSKIYP